MERMPRLLEVDNVYKRFGGLAAVDGLSFHVEEGESLALIGPNGAGKTTAFRLVMGDYRPDAGSVRFKGEDVSRLPTHARIARGIGRTYQVPRPFHDMTVADNIRVGMMPDHLWHMLRHGPDVEKENEIAARVGFKPGESGRRPGELSMGDLRKLELARALAAEPELMLLDEVFAGLTVGEIALISKLLAEERKRGMTLVIVSHDLRSLGPLVDRAIVMSFGKLIAEGPFEKVMADKTVREAYLGT
jgi:ABC-type branched-subunit amino acid transport system ATPase component